MQRHLLRGTLLEAVFPRSFRKNHRNVLGVTMLHHMGGPYEWAGWMRVVERATVGSRALSCLHLVLHARHADKRRRDLSGSFGFVGDRQ